MPPTPRPASLQEGGGEDQPQTKSHQPPGLLFVRSCGHLPLPLGAPACPKGSPQLAPPPSSFACFNAHQVLNTPAKHSITIYVKNEQWVTGDWQHGMGDVNTCDLLSGMSTNRDRQHRVSVMCFGQTVSLGGFSGKLHQPFWHGPKAGGHSMACL